MKLCLAFQTLFSQAFDLEAKDYIQNDDSDKTVTVKQRSWYLYLTNDY